MGRPGKYYWMVVEADKYELPLMVEDSAAAVGEKLGLSTHGVISMSESNNPGAKSGRKLVKILREDLKEC